MNQLNDITDQECLQMGRSILLLGLKKAMTLLQAQAETLENQLAVPAPAANGHGADIRPAMQRTMALIEEAEAPTVRKTRRTAKAKKKQGSRMREWWKQFTPEERKREMLRRSRVTKRNRKAAAR